jgi:hypothetical protein
MSGLGQCFCRLQAQHGLVLGLQVVRQQEEIKVSLGKSMMVLVHQAWQHSTSLHGLAALPAATTHHSVRS